MSDHTHYPKAPITEAIIDIRVLVKENARADEFDSLRDVLKGRYPTCVPLKATSMRFELREESTSHTQEAHVVGRMFQSQDQKYTYQARIDGLTLSRLAPYEDWATLKAEFEDLWGRYESLMKPKEVTRVAVRYINRLDLPLPFGDFKEYIRTNPEVAPDLSQLLSGFLMQLHIPQPDLEAKVILNEFLVPPTREGVASVVLDIDVTREGPKPLPMDFWDILTQLHQREYEVFEACITDKTRELIK